MLSDPNQPVDADDVVRLAAADGIALSGPEAEELLPVVRALTDIEELLDDLQDVLDQPTVTERDPGYIPKRDENPHNAFIRRCHVTGASGGPLTGFTVGLKDNVALAGIPTTNGSRVPASTPLRDAVVTERVLAAGGMIVGKLNMDDFGASGLGETSAFGPPLNPHDPTRSAGGSSGGCGAAIAAAEVDLALAVDQGGSGRIPAAFCGVVGIKPTHGLVPSWGIAHFDNTIDSVTPMSRDVTGAALLLEAVAGHDHRDAQWVRRAPEPERYATAKNVGVAGLRIGLVRESMDPNLIAPAVLRNLHACADRLARAGAVVDEVSIPLWHKGLPIFMLQIAHRFSETFRSGGQGVGHLGLYDVEALRVHKQVLDDNANALPQQVKAWLLADRLVKERSGTIPFAQLHNARLALRDAISGALACRNLLLTPTLPMTAPKLASPSASFAEISERTVAKLCFNTAPLNLSGHPALSLPSGNDANGLPTGAQLVGPQFGEMAVFAAAFALERTLRSSA